MTKFHQSIPSYRHNKILLCGWSQNQIFPSEYSGKPCHPLLSEAIITGFLRYIFSKRYPPVYDTFHSPSTYHVKFYTVRKQASQHYASFEYLSSMIIPSSGFCGSMIISANPSPASTFDLTTQSVFPVSIPARKV